MAEISTQAMATDTAALHAELKRLEEELERKRLEEEIRKLQSQLEESGAGGSAGQNESEEEEEVKAVEEYEEVSEYEEVVEEEEEFSPVTAMKHYQPAYVAPKLSGKKDNLFTSALAAKQAEADRKKEEKAARAEAAKPKSVAALSGAGTPGTGGGGVHAEEDESDLPPLPPLTQRTIPKTPASPAGSETPMEQLIGPKLYKQGKLVSTTTVAGCEGMDLILLFFGAGWQRECKPFAARLLDFYTVTTSSKVDNNDVKIECVYVPSDRNLNEFKQVFGKMPWLAMATQTSSYKNAMSKSMHIIDVPFLVVVEPSTGQIVSTRGVEEISACKRRDAHQYQALLRRWKSTTPIPMSEVEKQVEQNSADNLKRGVLYWHD